MFKKSLQLFAIYTSFLFLMGAIFASDPNYKTYPYFGQCAEVRNINKCDSKVVQTVGASQYSGKDLTYTGIILGGNCANKLMSFEHKDVIKYFECRK